MVHKTTMPNKPNLSHASSPTALDSPVGTLSFVWLALYFRTNSPTKDNTTIFHDIK